MHVTEPGHAQRTTAAFIAELPTSARKVRERARSTETTSTNSNRGSPPPFLPPTKHGAKWPPLLTDLASERVNERLRGPAAVDHELRPG